MRGWRTPEAVTAHVAPALGEGIVFHQGEVTHIDLENRRVQTSQGELVYDALVVALGAEVSVDSVPGLAEAVEHGLAGHYYTLPGALHLRERLASFAGGRVVLVIARLPYKCPPSPYEGILLIDDLLRERGLRERAELTIVTPEPRPLAIAPPPISEQLAELLAARDVTLVTGEQLQAVDYDRQEVLFASGKREPFDLLVVVPPHQPPAVVREAGLVDESGWITTALATMRTAVDGVWAVGDVTRVPLPNGIALPKAAVFAQAEAEVAARDLARTFAADAPVPEPSGAGRCWFIAGTQQVGAIDVDFLAQPGPAFRFTLPDAFYVGAMEAELVSWLARWGGHADSSDYQI
jgi:sulfide:quinone oxidoreductase